MGHFQDNKSGSRAAIPARRLPAWVTLAALAGSLAHASAPAHPSAASEELPRTSEAQREDIAAAAPPSPFGLGPALQARRLRGLRPQVVRRILTTRERGQLPIEALALSLGRGTDGTLVALFVEIDGASFLLHNQAETARLEVYAYALGPGGRVMGHLAEVFAVEVQKLGERIWQGGLKFYGGLELPAGSYDLRILVRSYDSGASGLRRIQVEVPIALTGEIMLPPVFSGSRQDAWLPVRGSRSGGADLFEDYPLVAANRAITPEARPVLVAGREAVCYLFASAPPSGRLRGVMEFLQEGSESRVVASSRIDAMGPVGIAERGLGVRELRFAPPELAPGRYGARLRLEGEAELGGFSMAVPVVVVGSDTRERDLVWSDLRWLMQGQLVPESVDPPTVAGLLDFAPAEKEPAGKAARRLADPYRNVLALLGEDPQAARGALFELESEVLRRGEAASLRRLAAAELAVAEELAEREVEAVVPIVFLHGEMLRLYRGRRLYFLVSHSRSMVEILAERYAELGGPTEVTAGVLVSEAGYLQEANLPASSRRLFWRALEHDPATPAALLGLAVSFEKYGEYPEAVEVLEQLVEVAPEIDEGWLRLAVNLVRVGRPAQSREILRDLVDRDAGEWVCAVAHQELARSYLAGGDAETAAELLERAVERMADRRSLRILLAHIYDRLGRTQAAFEQLLLIKPTTSDQPASARHIYDQWPRAIVEAARQDLNHAAARTRDVLARTLAMDRRVGTSQGG